MIRSLVESPSGLVHLVEVFSSGRIITYCGRETDENTWTRIKLYDIAMRGRSRSSIAAMIEMSKCDRCFK